MATINGTEGADTITSATNSAGGPTATGGNDRINGLSGNDLLAGGDGGDTLYGDKGFDTLQGEAGNDRFLIAGESLVEIDEIDGGAGRDTLDFTFWGTLPFLRLDLAANQVLGGMQANLLLVVAFLTAASIENAVGSAFDDVMVGDGDANEFSGRDGNDTLQGGTANDTLFGDFGDDRLEGGAGDDLLRGDGGADTLDGGAGVDWADYTPLAFALGITLAADGSALTSGAIAGEVLIGIENVRGGSAADTLIAEHAAANRLEGGAGADLLVGGAGDTLVGGGDSDTYVLLEPGVTIVEQAQANRRDRVGSPFDYTLPAEVEDLLLTGTAYLGRGNALGNGITGNDLANILDGGEGADTLDGGAGPDVLLGGAGDDLYLVDDAGDLVADADGIGLIRASISYTLPGSVTRLELTGSADLAGTGTFGNDSIGGNTGANLLRGGDGADSLVGEAGNDSLDGGNGNDSLSGSTDADTLIGGAGNDALSGGSEDDRLLGGGGADDLFGGIGRDLLVGGAGNDTLDGSADSDRLRGGAGADLFRLSFSTDRAQADRILDFNRDEGDELALSGFPVKPTGFIANPLGRPEGPGAQIIYDTDSGHLWCDLDGTGPGQRFLLAVLQGSPVLTGADVLILS